MALDHPALSILVFILRPRIPGNVLIGDAIKRTSNSCFDEIVDCKHEERIAGVKKWMLPKTRKLLGGRGLGDGGEEISSCLLKRTPVI